MGGLPTRLYRWTETKFLPASELRATPRAVHSFERLSVAPNATADLVHSAAGVSPNINSRVENPSLKTPGLSLVWPYHEGCCVNCW
jgi:hypothetical protein